MLEYTNTIMRLNPQQFLTANGAFGKNPALNGPGLLV
jgi:hypothetical protein